MILARTIKGKGLAAIEGKDGWHGKALKKGEEADKAIAELEKQMVPGDVEAGDSRAARRRAGAGQRGRLLEDSGARPTSWAIRSRRAKPGASRWRPSARSIRASSRSTPT